MTTPDRTTARADEAAQILTGRGGNPATLPSPFVTIPNYSPPPLSPMIQILGAPNRRRPVHSKAIVQTSSSRSRIWYQQTAILGTQSTPEATSGVTMYYYYMLNYMLTVYKDESPLTHQRPRPPEIESPR